MGSGSKKTRQKSRAVLNAGINNKMRAYMVHPGLCLTLKMGQYAGMSFLMARCCFPYFTPTPGSWLVLSPAEYCRARRAIARRCVTHAGLFLRSWLGKRSQQNREMAWVVEKTTGCWKETRILDVTPSECASVSWLCLGL